MRRPHLSAYAAGTALLLALAGCSSGDGADVADPTPAEATGTTAQSPPDSPTPGGGTRPTPLEPGVDLLDWQPVPGSVDDVVTVAGRWTLTVSADGARATLDGPTPTTVRAEDGHRISTAQIDDAHALVVSQDTREQRPATATLVDLDTGATSAVGGGSEVPTTTGGTWALAGDHAFYATYGGPSGRAYCLASVDLASVDLASVDLASVDLVGGSQQQVWCAPQRQGFSNARAGADGALSLLTFDDSQPSCRTLVSLAGANPDDPDPDLDPAPYADPTACKGWEGVTLDDATVWTEIPKESRIEQAVAYAAGPDGIVELGDATSGTLIACDGAAYFARDAGGGEPAKVLRWSPETGLDAVYRAPGGSGKGRDGFVVAPLRCGGDHLTLTALTSAGDEQVTAPLR
jgi:hypothetical protein